MQGQGMLTPFGPGAQRERGVSSLVLIFRNS